MLLDQELGATGAFDDGLWRLYWNESVIRQYTHEERRAAPPATPALAIEREFHYRERAAGAELTLARAFEPVSGPHRLLGGIEYTETRIVERRDGLQTNLATGVSTSTILGEVLPVRDFPVSRIREAGVYLQDGFHYRERVAGAEAVLARDLTTAGGSHPLTGGLEFAETRVVERREGLQTNLATGATTSTILGDSLPVRDFPVTTIREAGVYFQDEWRPGDGRWSLIQALRADWYRLTPLVDATYAADNPSEPPVAVEETSLSPKLAFGWRLRDDVSLYLQYAHGFRSPPFDDVNIGLDLPQFNTRAIPNPDLRPERSDSLELGLRFSGAVLSGSASVYGSRYRDFIESRVNIGVEPGTGTTLFQSRNLARAEIVGAEAALGLDLGAWRHSLDGFSARLAAGVAAGDDTARDRPINGIDPPRGTIGIRYETRSGTAGVGLDLTVVGAKHDVDESSGPLYRPGGYAVVDLRLQWRPHPRVTASVGLFNLGDRRYYEWATVRGRVPGDPLLPLYREPGRSFAVTVSATVD